MEFPSKSDRIIIFSPHPDDDVLATGGLLQQIVKMQIPVRIVFLTDGDNNPWPQRFIERCWKINKSDRQRWGNRRRSEALAALNVLGIDSKHAIFLGLPDQGLTSLLLQQNEVVVQKIAHEMVVWNPTVVIAPAEFDLHPDHNAFSVMLQLAFKSLGNETRASIKTLYFSIHPDMPHSENILSVNLSSQEVAIKKSALLHHESQMRLSGKRYLSYVNEKENFYLSPTCETNGSHHPVKAACSGDGYVNLFMKRPTFLNRLFRPVLYVLSISSPRFSISLRLDFFARDKVKIFDASGSAIPAFGHIFWLKDSVLIKIPEAILGYPEDVYVKQTNPLGFLDSAGWQGLPISKRHASENLPYVLTVALIPCYNVASFCAEVIKKTLERVDKVIVIDDGSTDDTRHILSALSADSGGRLHVINKARNEGKGCALLDGMHYALDHFQFSALITIDGDGQHCPEDIPMAEQSILHDKDFVIGQRNFRNMPLRSSFGNNIISRMFHALYPRCPSDTQSGFRAFSSRMIQSIVLSIHPGRYETELHILLLALCLGIEVDTFDIDTIYIDENRSSHFRPVFDSMRILLSLLRWQMSTVI